MIKNKFLLMMLIVAVIVGSGILTDPYHIVLANSPHRTLLTTTPLTSPVISSWTVSPWAAPADSHTQIIIKASVDDPDGDLSGVTIDLSPLGGGTAVYLHDDGLHSDGVENDGIFGLVVTIPTGTSTGEIPFNLTATDAQGNQTFVYIGTFALLSPTNPNLPAVLPSHLGWGTSEDGWQETTGLPWDYVGHFLTWNWHDWNENFVSQYLQDAWAKNEIPILTFDMLLGADDCNGLSEMDCDYAHLQDSTIMQGYFDRVTLAASQAVGSMPVIFHIESDVSAYMQRYSIDHSGQNGILADEPSSIPAKSLSQNYPDTFAGAIQHMVDIIHSQAPNALVALHARSWSTGMDVAGNIDPHLDVAEIGRRTAYFLTQSGGPNLDLILTDWKVWDAGSGYSPWWDITNRVLPHFNRILYWQNQIVRNSNLPLILWKLPAGNMGLDNTCQHYQDNRVDYAFEHSSDLVNSGIIGVLVGAADDCRTLPSTDNDNILLKGTVFYNPPTTPGSFMVVATDNPREVKLSWEGIPEFDGVSYIVYLGRDPENMTIYSNVQLQTSLKLLLPSGGIWYVSVKVVDAYGQQSELAEPVMVDLFNTPFTLMLPIILH